MKILIQRSLESSVYVQEKLISKINKGMVLLVCLEKGDEKAQVEKAAKKIASLRIFKDPNTKKMNKNITDDGGEILAVSQFTLSWGGEKGNRPSFDGSMPPEEAELLFKYFINELRQRELVVKTGAFGEEMQLHICNDGPVSFFMHF